MRDELSATDCNTNNDCMIINFDHNSNDGTHWTCLFKKNTIIYFDSFGLKPPVKVKKYFDKSVITGVPQKMCSTFQVQNPNDVICGHICIYVLYKLSNCETDFFTLLDELYQYNHARK